MPKHPLLPSIVEGCWFSGHSRIGEEGTKDLLEQYSRTEFCFFHLLMVADGTADGASISLFLVGHFSVHYWPLMDHDPKRQRVEGGYAASGQNDQNGLVWNKEWGCPKEEDGNWRCPSCQNVNFARRSQCNRCSMPKPYGDDGYNQGALLSVFQFILYMQSRVTMLLVSVCAWLGVHRSEWLECRSEWLECWSRVWWRRWKFPSGGR